VCFPSNKVMSVSAMSTTRKESDRVLKHEITFLSNLAAIPTAAVLATPINVVPMLWKCYNLCCSVTYSFNCFSYSLTTRAEFPSAKAIMDGFGGADLTISKLRAKRWSWESSKFCCDLGHSSELFIFVCKSDNCDVLISSRCWGWKYVIWFYLKLWFF
jgi:hypothetical protein